MTAEHDHDSTGETSPIAELITVRDWLRYAVTRFNRAEIFCGHGVTNTFDEAVWLILATLALPQDRLEPFLDACIPEDERGILYRNIQHRADERVPTAYLVGEAWLGDYRFYVDERVIVPRSYFAELLNEGFAPWIADAEAVTSALDLCTGSGCLAVLMADAFPNADIVAADIDAGAIAVAQRNLSDYGLEKDIDLVESDVFSALADRQFDLIICNPPYVTTKAMTALPAEYLHEPRSALAAGKEGLDIIRRLINEASSHLTPDGLLAVEVGHNRDLVEAAFPALPFTWVSGEDGTDAVFLLNREALSQT